MWNKKWQNKNLVETLNKPKCKYKKVSRTKNGGTKIWWGPSGTLSASTERSAEQKMAEQKFWWRPLQTLSASTKRSVEQKCGTKSAETIIFWGPPRTPSASTKRLAEKKLQKKNNGDHWGPKVQVQKSQWNKNWWGPLGTQGSLPILVS